MKKKVPKFFSNVLFTIGIAGLIAIILRWFGIFKYDSWINYGAIILMGIGFLAIGKIRFVLSFPKNGLSSAEIAHIFTIIAGGLLIFSGIYGFTRGDISQPFHGVIGVSYIVSLFVVLYERFM